MEDVELFIRCLVASGQMLFCWEVARAVVSFSRDLFDDEE